MSDATIIHGDRRIAALAADLQDAVDRHDVTLGDFSAASAAFFGATIAESYTDVHKDGDVAACKNLILEAATGFVMHLKEQTEHMRVINAPTNNDTAH